MAIEWTFIPSSTETVDYVNEIDAQMLTAPMLPFGLCIESTESHSRLEQDWYAATVAVDLLAFLYTALFYQASCCVMSTSVVIYRARRQSGKVRISPDVK